MTHLLSQRRIKTRHPARPCCLGHQYEDGSAPQRRAVPLKSVTIRHRTPRPLPGLACVSGSVPIGRSDCRRGCNLCTLDWHWEPDGTHVSRPLGSTRPSLLDGAGAGARPSASVRHLGCAAILQHGGPGRGGGPLPHPASPPCGHGRDSAADPAAEVLRAARAAPDGQDLDAAGDGGPAQLRWQVPLRLCQLRGRPGGARGYRAMRTLLGDLGSRATEMPHDDFVAKAKSELLEEFGPDGALNQL